MTKKISVPKAPPAAVTLEEISKGQAIRGPGQLTRQQALGRLQAFGITNKGEALEVSQLIDRLNQPEEELYLKPWANSSTDDNPRDCAVYIEDVAGSSDGIAELRLIYPNGTARARYLNKADARAIIAWLQAVLERLS